MTIWRVRVHPDVVNVDLAEAITYYGELDSTLPERLAEDFTSGLRRIEAHPTLMRVYLTGWRRVLLTTFPYLLSYAVDGHDVFVAGLFHSRRDPDAVRAALATRRNQPDEPRHHRAGSA